MIIKIDNLSNQEKIDLIRKTLNSLPPLLRKEEVERAYRIENEKPAFILETPDGEIIKVTTVKGIRNAIAELTGRLPDRSNIYKALREESKTVFGIKIKKVFEGDSKWEF